MTFQERFDRWLLLSEEDKKKENPFVDHFKQKLKNLPKVQKIWDGNK